MTVEESKIVWNPIMVHHAQSRGFFKTQIDMLRGGGRQCQTAPETCAKMGEVAPKRGLITGGLGALARRTLPSGWAPSL